ncbi:MAG TPA: alpha-amylase family glycosyl hydrolase [Anaerolineae bacterium]|nr:alpha-amylase family glycosyl hydrolase [Anaerolineae bacterium]
MALSALREFHVSRDARTRYQFDDPLFAFNGNVIFANFHAARVFAQKMNDKRDVVNFPERAVKAGQINAMGLIDELLHVAIARYRETRAPRVMEEALRYMEDRLGRDALNAALATFADEFPPVAVHRGTMPLEDYLNGVTHGTPHREVILEEMLLLWLANLNPAFDPFVELFEDARLERETAYEPIMRLTYQFFDTQPRFGAKGQNLIDMLRAPALASPHSLEGQLDYIRSFWGEFLGEYLYRLLSSLDFLAEEEKVFFGFGPGPAQVYEFGGMVAEPENFSPDSAWMPRVVLIAKNVYVWLDQLSKEYKRTITTLDQVPDRELDKLGAWGITGLWLIGVWQRSEASRRIKQIMGNPEAVASAYSLDEYRVADDLGGEAAFDNLKHRAWQRGVRMATDMVPNHVGIDARWVIEHPDWFVSLPYPPFPTYSYNSEDLSRDGRVGIYLEDHYYSRNDAAVTFKRLDHWTGDARYIYHGNDGTSMPWNDTAQLNYLNPEVREAVIQTILQVARRSPIIRFDAAMTLTKRHYQRLWFPEPGTGGDIPSRADFGMTKAAFDGAMPEEFWREVVDRVAAELPDTLLLAEAFWLMEGYFVRTLGMHRVYNSAFMNMLRDEKNAEYRQVIKNTLEFDPQILKRYVNFMNNPDERTAVDQYGKGDKYFGICTLMSTMPGLPMFGHGQVEGYTEKYGMEYRRAYWDETPDVSLVERHEKQIFPILHKRYLFAEVENFLLYDFYTPEGHVDENVFAYSNRMGGERALVIYHNRYAETRGYVRISAAFAAKGGAGEKSLVQRTLADGLSIPADSETFLVFRDAVSGLEYIRNAAAVYASGLYAELHAYQVHVFIDFREIRDNVWRQYAQLTTYLNGRGVPDVEEALKELFLEPVHAPFRMLVSAPAFHWLAGERGRELSALPVAAESAEGEADVLTQVEQKMGDLLAAVAHTATGKDATPDDVAPIAREVRVMLMQLLTLSQSLPLLAAEHPVCADAVAYVLRGMPPDDRGRWGIALSWLFTRDLGRMVSADPYAEISRSWLDEWLLGKLIGNALREMGLDDGQVGRSVALLKALLGYRRWLPAENAPREAQAYHLLHTALQQPEVQTYLGINRHRGILWFNKEAFEHWLWWLMLVYTLESLALGEGAATRLAAFYQIVRALLAAEAESDYQVAKLLEAFSARE